MFDFYLNFSHFSFRYSQLIEFSHHYSSNYYYIMMMSFIFVRVSSNSNCCVCVFFSLSSYKTLIIIFASCIASLEYYYGNKSPCFFLSAFFRFLLFQTYVFASKFSSYYIASDTIVLLFLSFPHYFYEIIERKAHIHCLFFAFEPCTRLCIINILFGIVLCVEPRESSRETGAKAREW